MDPLLAFLQKWLAQKIQRYGVERGAISIEESIDQLLADPAKQGCTVKLGDAEKALLAALKEVNRAKKPFLNLFGRQDRGIAVLGPSGAGKTVIADRLRDATSLRVDRAVRWSPRERPRSSIHLEKTRTVARGKILPVLTVPGTQIQSRDGWDRLAQTFLDSPPQVVVVTVAGGFLATADRDLEGTFRRPNSSKVLANLEEYLRACRAEEARHVNEFMDFVKARRKVALGRESIGDEDVLTTRIRAFVTVVNKRDLWGIDPKGRLAETYRDPFSDYGKAINRMRRTWGPGDGSTHDVLPMFTFGGGFHPYAEARGLMLTEAHAAADTLLLKALLLYRFAGASAGA